MNLEFDMNIDDNCISVKYQRGLNPNLDAVDSSSTKIKEMFAVA